MSAPKLLPHTDRRPTFTADANGVLVATWPSVTFRFMFDDGRTVDVVSQHDTSDLRAAVLAHCRAEKIAGCVVLPAQTQLELEA
jgi:hypothetical protein